MRLKWLNQLFHVILMSASLRCDVEPALFVQNFDMTSVLLVMQINHANYFYCNTNYYYYTKSFVITS